MNLRSALAAVSLALGVTLAATGSLAAAPQSGHTGATKPSIHIKSLVVSGTCITVRVSVSHFRLVKPVYSPPIPALKGNQGHIHYTLNGNILPTRDATTKLSHTFCGSHQFVRRGRNVLKVYLATALHTPFPGAAPVVRVVMVK